MTRPAPPSRSRSMDMNSKSRTSPTSLVDHQRRPQRDSMKRKSSRVNVFSKNPSPSDGTNLRRSSFDETEKSSSKKSGLSFFSKLLRRRKHISNSSRNLDVSVHRCRHKIDLSTIPRDGDDDNYEEMVPLDGTPQRSKRSTGTTSSESSDYTNDSLDLQSGALTEQCSNSCSSAGSFAERMADRLAKPRPPSASLSPPSSGCIKTGMTSATNKDALNRNEEGRTIRWGDIDVHSHAMTLGDNPSCGGPPLSLEWVSHETVSIGVDLYEEARPDRRSKAQLVMPREVRENILRQAGFARSYLKEATDAGAEIRASREKNATSSTVSSFKGLIRWH